MAVAPERTSSTPKVLVNISNKATQSIRSSQNSLQPDIELERQPFTKDLKRYHTNGAATEEKQEDHESSESANEENTAQSTPRITERRRAQNVIFTTWLSKQAEATQDQTRAKVQNTEDELLSIRNLMAKQESKVIIGDPREYQVELFERAKLQNTIAVLDTGSGKTLIAVLLLRHVLEQELEDRAVGKAARIAFFLVDKVALVFQQFAVLECNLDQSIERFCGEMNVDLFSAETWTKYFKDNMVIVCTADILYHCLLNSFISMDRINLLIFDEAHHAKKNHTYARIIKDCYLKEEEARRPRIFGMTASPVDAKVDVVEAANQLEALLHCRIATAANLSLLRHAVSRPNELILQYDRLPRPYHTELCGKLGSKFKDLASFEKIFRGATEAASELGEWCADRLWYLALADEEAAKLEFQIERHFHQRGDAQPVEILDNELKLLHDAKAVVDEHPLQCPLLQANGISSKVQVLKDYLDLLFERPNDSRCIIFVTRRYTARLLADLLKKIGNSNCRVDVIIGARAGAAGDNKLTIRQQMLKLMNFRKGILNILVATSIAEEGLDVPDCNCVIRFDLYSTLIQYIQSRGRARHANSKFVQMVETGNPMHVQVMREVREGENVMRSFCEALPDDRLLHGNDHDLNGVLIPEKSFPIFIEPETGAKLTYGSVLGTLERFVACLPLDTESGQRANFIMSTEGRNFVCEVILPSSSPIRSVLGRPHARKSIAKRSAAFEACVLLRRKGHLDKHLLPKYHKHLPAMRNAHLALNVKTTNTYNMRLKPSLWEIGRGSLPKELYLTILDLENTEALGRPFTPIALLTRTPLIPIPKFPLYPRPSVVSNVEIKSINTAFKVGEDVIAKITSFTLRIYFDLYNKTFENRAVDMSYWFVPVVRNQAEAGFSSPKDFIDWASVEFVHENQEIPWNEGTPHSELEGKFLIDRWDGGRRFFSTIVRPDLRPLDPVPKESPPHRFMNNILDYTVSLFSKSRQRATWKPNQPVIEAHRILHRRNWLDEWSEQDKKAVTLSYICPEPLKFSALPAPVAAMGYMIPAIIYRIEAYLVAQEACDMLGLKIKPDLALEAVTKDSDNTDEHKETQIHFQRGMGRNYERLEFIGDAFLKMATSISLFVQNAEDDEFDFHVKRMLMICNKNLFNTALEIDLYEFIRSQAFSRRTWYPEGLKLLEGKGKNAGKQIHQHRLGDKSIADVCEALIGASLLSFTEGGNMDMAVRAVTVMVKSSDHRADKFKDYARLYKKPFYQTAPCTASQMDLCVQVSKKDGYNFKYPRLLRSAFIHPSCPFSWEKIPCYQRLEFLGDSLLDMVCVNFLFHRYPDRDPQWLTEHKMAMVSNKFLGALCVRIGFHKHLRQSHPSLPHQIQEYVDDVTEAESDSKNAMDYWTTTKNPPKCLPDMLEAYLGALFIDSSFSFAEVVRFFDQHIAPFFFDMSLYDSFANAHPTTFLSNILSTSLGCTNYRVLARETLTAPDDDDGRGGSGSGTASIVAAVLVHSTVVAHAGGNSGRYAKAKASALAVEKLKGLGRWEFARQYECDCSTIQDVEGGVSGIGNTNGAVPEGIGSAI